MKNRILTMCLLVALSMSSNQAFGATAKAGGSCTKVGLKSGALICAKVGGKLKWTIVRKAQTIKYSHVSQATIANKTVSFPYSSTSKLAVTATALTPDICAPGKATISFSGTPGLCRISLKQSGNAHYLPAKPVLVEFKVYGTNIIDFKLPGALLLSQGTFQLSATSSSNLPVLLLSSTLSTCTVVGSIVTLLQAGTCTIVASQGGDEFIPSAISITQNVEISTNRVTADLPDTVSGFQIKPVYVVPSDAADNSYDINGYIAGILDEGNNYLKSQIGYSVPIDSTNSGYDIQYLKSQFTTEYLRTNDANPDPTKSDGEVLLKEIKAMENPGDNRKDYIFFIEVPGFDGRSCGLADTPGMVAVVALENLSSTQTCRGTSTSPFANFTSKTWIHELIHNFGVDHTPNNSCDLMYGGGTSGPCTAPEGITVDKTRSLYVGASSSQGPDILKLRVWEGHTADVGYTADCLTAPVDRSDGLPYAYCPTGTRNIGSLESCWQGIQSVELDEMIGGVWTSLGTGSSFTKFWGGELTQRFCTDPNYPLSVFKQVTVNTPGIRHYRWLTNGQVGDEMNIIWVR